MKKLWAPWRTVYINEAKKKTKGCIFCRADKEKRDKKNLILFRGELSFIIMNRYPYSNGHLMIAPYRHVGELKELTRQEVVEIFELIDKAITASRKAMRPQGFNVGMNLGRVAGAGVEDHVHVHLVPRWLGDTNFMPIFGETKVISEALAGTYKKLKKVL